MYRLVFAPRFKKSFRKYRQSGVFPLEKFERALACLRAGEPLPLSYSDHALKGSLAHYREFHIAQDVLVQYEQDEVLELITLRKIGTHTELFGA
ncbi:MAG TPA: type II toxin-antitoxin system YafQ family toxin [Candidatus Paceibacterota bacterium]|nr:type II toxin-antitoxin system YafQ family toxin [Candidatus Paceibacterota bacterium]